MKIKSCCQSSTILFSAVFTVLILNSNPLEARARKHKCIDYRDKGHQYCLIIPIYRHSPPSRPILKPGNCIIYKTRYNCQ